MNLKLRFISLAVLLVTACERKEVNPFVEVRGLLNGIEWARPDWTFKGKAYPIQGVASYPCPLPAVSISIYALNPQGYERESLFITKIPKRLGRYPITDIYACDQNANVGAAYYVLGADGDVLRAIFDVVESADNYIVVEQIDSVANRWVGRLQVTLAAKPENLSLDTPYDTVRLTNCRFSLPFVKD